ncbi:hypothetical protein BDQ17DRAFT_1246457, partial [Cyathus striatus]
LSMSWCSTIPFILPIYDSLEKHLNAASVSLDLPMEQCTSTGVRILKLLKYKQNAVTNHNYILGTGMYYSYNLVLYCFIMYIITIYQCFTHSCTQNGFT